MTSLISKTIAFADSCPCCGSTLGTEFRPVMWQALGDEWGLSAEEYAYIDRQQGETCRQCRSNLRSQALALAIVRAVGFRGTFREFTGSIRGRMMRILEINQAGDLTHFFRRRSRHVLRSYPNINMVNMIDVGDALFDLVIHSETLEHVPDPVQGLRECSRILRPGGACCFTVPIVVERLSRTRDGLSPSYHGADGDSREDYRVQTEYGADAWRQVIEAGFAECRIVAVKPPAAHALIGVKG